MLEGYEHTRLYKYQRDVPPAGFPKQSDAPSLSPKKNP